MSKWLARVHRGCASRPGQGLTPRHVKHSFTCMLKSIAKIGNSQGLILDAALLELAHLKVGDEVNVEVHEGGTLTITPIRSQPSQETISRTIKATMKDYRRTMKKLA
jgi:antitoxin component of MazEF toxin-antitoxin module